MPAPSPALPHADAPAWRWACAAAVAWGALLRVDGWRASRGLWFDETTVATSILGRSLAELRPPFDSIQMAPLPFWAQSWLSLHLFGFSERVLRLPPLLWGVLTLALGARLAWRLQQPRTAALSAVMLATAPALLQYSDELKPYAMDAGIGVGLLLAATALRRGTLSIPALAALGVGGLLCSFPAPLVLAGVGLAALAARPRAWPALVGTGALWAGVAAGGVAWYRSQTQLGRLDWYFSFGYWTPERFWDRAGFVGEILLYGAGVPYWPAWTLPAGLGLGVGLVVLARRGGLGSAILLAAPLGALVAASVAGAYPISTRTALFALPVLVLLLAEALGALLDRLPARLQALGAAVLGVAALQAPGLRPVVWASGMRPSTGALREPIAALTAALRPGDGVYLPPRSVPGWMVYTTDWDQPDRARLAQAERWGTTIYSSTPDQRRYLGLDPREGLTQARGHPEILGQTSGLFQRWPIGSAYQQRDLGWLDAELARILTLDLPGLGLLCVADDEKLCPALQEALRARGWTCAPIRDDQATRCGP